MTPDQIRQALHNARKSGGDAKSVAHKLGLTIEEVHAADRPKPKRRVTCNPEAFAKAVKEIG